MKRVLSNVQKGYAEVYYYPDGDVKGEHLLYTGYVVLKNVPVGADFTKDEIRYTTRWFAALYIAPGAGLNGFQLIGKTATGYASRSLALQGLEKAILDIYGPWTGDENAPLLHKDE